MWSITKEGKIIFIELNKITKLEYYNQHYGLFISKKDAIKSRNYRKFVSDKYLKGIE